MRKEKLLYIILGVLFVTYVIVEYYSPKPLDWTVTFSQNDKNPYGGYILYERLDDFFAEKAVSFQTLYEARDTEANLLILTTDFAPSDADMEAIYNILDQGRTVLIGAQIFSEKFLDDLGIDTKTQVLESITEDSVQIELEGEKTINMPPSFVNITFEVDSSTIWKSHATSGGDVLISKDYPTAKLILTSLPLAFSNYGLVQNNILLFAEAALNKIPEGSVHYNRYYQAGKQEP